MKAYWAFIVLLILSFIFLQFPGLDLWASSHFYDLSSHHFWLDNNKIILLRRAILACLWILNAVLLLVLLLKLVAPHWVRKLKAKTAIYILICFLLAPGLMVNSILKEEWGRARPAQIQEFGGNALFQSAWKISQQCSTNCSFVCGDCSMVFALFAFVPLCRRRALATALVSLAGLSMGFLRLGAGGHFLSDVLMSGLIVYLVEAAVYWAFYQQLREQSVEQFFIRIHSKIIRGLK